jgi:hypothetical protein
MEALNAVGIIRDLLVFGVAMRVALATLRVARRPPQAKILCTDQLALTAPKS